jgi:hypothetical protein
MNNKKETLELNLNKIVFRGKKIRILLLESRDSVLDFILGRNRAKNKIIKMPI